MLVVGVCYTLLFQLPHMLSFASEIRQKYNTDPEGWNVKQNNYNYPQDMLY